MVAVASRSRRSRRQNHETIDDIRARITVASTPTFGAMEPEGFDDFVNDGAERQSRFPKPRHQEPDGVKARHDYNGPPPPPQKRVVTRRTASPKPSEVHKPQGQLSAFEKDERELARLPRAQSQRTRSEPWLTSTSERSSTSAKSSSSRRRAFRKTRSISRAILDTTSSRMKKLGNSLRNISLHDPGDDFSENIVEL